MNIYDVLRLYILSSLSSVLVLIEQWAFSLHHSRLNVPVYENITENVQTFGVFPLLLRPRSRGYIKLKSTDPNEAPLIVPNYFDDPYDLQVLVRYISYVLFL